MMQTWDSAALDVGTSSLALLVIVNMLYCTYFQPLGYSRETRIPNNGGMAVSCVPNKIGRDYRWDPGIPSQELVPIVELFHPHILYDVI